MALKLIAFAAFLEYLVIQRWLSPSDSTATDFIGFVLCHAVFAFFGKLHLAGLPEPQRNRALLNGLVGGAIGYLWLFWHLTRAQRQMHHVLIANVLMLAGVTLGAWDQRRRKGGRLRTSGGRRLQ